ncbi:hypothetical protein NESM_000330800 [Novymonas esmeraldas]|uniref:Uncharacterized protein n=1 Tax=Novymonas esmeraldas TaxID=1808958 RepID=A0AAW0EJ56_9TRYP
MLQPRALRAALLDELVSSSSAVDQDHEVAPLPVSSEAQNAVAGVRAASSPATRYASVPNTAHSNTTTTTSSSSLRGQCVVHDSVLRRGQTRAVTSSGAPSTQLVSPVAAAAPTTTAVVAESRRSILLSFMDNCISAGVPEAVIAEQVQFMVASMQESLALHAALHARQHAERIRDYELSELAAMLERQQLQQQQQQQQQQSAVSLADPACSSTAFAAAPLPEPKAVHQYVSLSQRRGSEAGRGAAATHTSPRSPTAVPVSAWRASAKDENHICDAQPRKRTGAGPARLRSRTRSPAPPPRRSAAGRSAHHRHDRHHSNHLCNVCCSSAASAAAAAPSTVEACSSTAQRSPTARWRQRYTPTQHYMRPTHASIARQGSRSPTSSPVRGTSPPVRVSGSARYGDPATTPWHSAGNSPLTSHTAEVMTGSSVEQRRSTPRRLLVRQTLSSRLRAAAAAATAASSQPETGTARSSFIALPDHDRDGEHEIEVKAGARGSALARRATPHTTTTAASAAAAAAAAAVRPRDVWSTTQAPSARHRLSIEPEPSSSATGSSGGDGGADDVARTAAAMASHQPATHESAAPATPPQPLQQQQQQQRPTQDRRPRRAPPPPAPPLAASATDHSDDDDHDNGGTDVCVTSPALQHFMERSQHQLRETARMLSHGSTPSHITAASHVVQSPSPIFLAITPTDLRALLDSTATSSHAPSSSAEVPQAPEGRHDWSHDAARARQRQRLADLHRRLSGYDTAADAATAVASAPPASSRCSSVFVPHSAPPAALEDSAFQEVSPTSSDESTHDSSDVGK